MPTKTHHYRTNLRWTGNTGQGTRSYRGYARDHEIAAAGKPAILASSDPAFRGDPARWNPEELLLASASACHQLWYLHLCAVAGVTVLAYEDAAEATMEEEPSGAGQFAGILLRPTVTIAADSNPETARALHHEANEHCFIARSLKTPIRHDPTIIVAPG
ncbi:OsmC family protein [Acidiphilium sp. AL]|uniref:OsmC family protein n=1 Tax=Acidiphilium iwatense TaxID=768198 RepID=A0ABS9DX27_9PROT|nr:MULTISPECIES: OsmC family protein [Acidiphilium]MCF3946360.1 OsmC family protein [Acidiphilium iwatense]MCU4159856.1 OsmC family protein [Acidiphilium sp. AL]